MAPRHCHVATGNESVGSIESGSVVGADWVQSHSELLGCQGLELNDELVQDKDGRKNPGEKIYTHHLH